MGQFGVMNHVPILAVHRDEVLWSQQLVEGAQFALARVARGVDRLVTRVDHFGRGPVQIVDDATDRPLVAGNRMGTEDHRVVGADLQEPGVAARELGQGGERLALAAGADNADLAGRVTIDVLDVDQIGGVDVQEVQLARQFGVGLHRATHEHDLAVLF